MQKSIKLSVDAVVFGYESGTISVLLIKRKYEPFKGNWAIPGGFVLEDESLKRLLNASLKKKLELK